MSPLNVGEAYLFSIKNRKVQKGLFSTFTSASLFDARTVFIVLS